MDEELLSVVQVLLLENLTYLANKDDVMYDLAEIQKTDKDKVFTVREIVNRIDIDQLDENIDYSTYENGEDWWNILNAIQEDDTLLNMTMIAVKEGTEETGGTAKKQIRVGKERLGEKENKDISCHIIYAACTGNCGDSIPQI